MGWYHGVVPTHGRGANITCCPEGISAYTSCMLVMRRDPLRGTKTISAHAPGSNPLRGSTRGLTKIKRLRRIKAAPRQLAKHLKISRIEVCYMIADIRRCANKNGYNVNRRAVSHTHSPTMARSAGQAKRPERSVFVGAGYPLHPVPRSGSKTSAG